MINSILLFSIFTYYPFPNYYGGGVKKCALYFRPDWSLSRHYFETEQHIGAKNRVCSFGPLPSAI